jgi:hypothetical protein
LEIEQQSTFTKTGGLMSDSEWFVMQVETAQAYGRPHDDGFLVRAGSTAMKNGSPKVKRDRPERDRLLRVGTLIDNTDPLLLSFAKDHLFNSPSLAGGVVKDGNCSGPQSWRRERDGKKLSEIGTNT